MANYRLFVKGLKQIVQIVDDNSTEYLVKDGMNRIKILNDPENGLAILVDSDGKFAYVGDVEEAEKRLENGGNVKMVETSGAIAIPGFVDGHSHPVFAGDRVHEFAMKLAGATYMEVQEAGGGIMFTTNATREASEQQLRDDFEQVAMKMLKSGTTTLEAKSGYGLNKDAEMKMLRVLAAENPRIPLEISATFCGAHAVPKGSTESEQTRMICDELIPAIVAEKKSGGMRNLENIDVFCEKGVFEIESSQKILENGKAAGMAVNFHAEELKYIGGVEMGAKIGVSLVS
ncbi:unnamed protein product [Caenorhabditis sp. 36 PRJEB53466]|nr:unnamed protein product [Caenorhabditis sp. 36 PRJEB53466]